MFIKLSTGHTLGVVHGENRERHVDVETQRIHTNPDKHHDRIDPPSGHYEPVFSLQPLLRNWSQTAHIA